MRMDRRIIESTAGKIAIGGLLALGFLGLMMMLSGLHDKAWAGPRKGLSNFANKPNVVLIQADDLVRSDIRYMPNVKRFLGRGGTTFTNFNAPYPLCGPARAALLTGQLSHNNRILANFESNDGGYYKFRDLPGRLNQRNSLGPWMKRAGYRTGFVGKYINEYATLDLNEVPPGWDSWKGLLDQSTYDYYNYAMNINGKVKYWGDPEYAKAQVNLGTLGSESKPESFGELFAIFRQAFVPWDYFGWQRPKDYTMDVNGRMARNFVRKSVRSRKPFFLYYATPGPHAEDTNNIQGLRPGAPPPDPRPPKRYEHTFDHVDLPRPPAFNEADVSDKAANVKDLPLLSEEKIEEIEENYRGRLGAVKSIDDQVGKIVRSLRRGREMRRTVIIFTSDNGYLQGEHRLAASKFLPFENSIRVPLLMRGPGIKKGRKVTRMSMDVDLTPTILKAGRAEPGRLMDGVSLLRAARKKSALPKRDLPLEAHRSVFKFTTPLTKFDLPFYGVKTHRYKYIHWSFDELELYDMKKDPHELRNIAGKPRMAKVVARMEKKALRLSECKGRSCR